MIGTIFTCKNSSDSTPLSIAELEAFIGDPNLEEKLIKRGYKKLPQNEGNSSVTITYAIEKKETEDGKPYWSQMIDKPKKRPGIGYTFTDEKLFLDLKKQILETGEDKGERRGTHIIKAKSGNNFAFKIDSSKKDIPTNYRIMIEKPLK